VSGTGERTPEGTIARCWCTEKDTRGIWHGVRLIGTISLLWTTSMA